MRESIERWKVLFSGRVQGVGFRYTAVRIAQSFTVVGFVRNLADGRVELVAEASPQQLKQFVDEVCQATHGYVSDKHIDRQESTGEFADFSVRY